MTFAASSPASARFGHRPISPEAVAAAPIAIIRQYIEQQQTPH